MKINAKITMLASSEGLTIEVTDEDSRARFLNIHLTPEQFSSAMGRLALTDCEVAEVHQLDKVGLVMEMQKFEFIIGETGAWRSSEMKESAKNLAITSCPDGWEPDLYFGSQGSFFEKDGKSWARTYIRRWVKKD